jgi:hypothetical protein
MSDKKSIEFLQALAAGQRLICEGIQEEQNKIKSLEADLALAKEKLAESAALIVKYHDALVSMRKDIVRTVDIECDFPDEMSISTVMNARQYKKLRDALKKIQE